MDGSENKQKPQNKTGFGGLDFDLPSAIYVLWYYVVPPR